MALTAEQIAFLDAFAACGNLSQASRMVGADVSVATLKGSNSRTPEAIRKAHYREWLADEEYAAEFAVRIPLASGTLEDAAIDRAVTGWFDPIYQGGELVGKIWRYDSGLLKFLLRGNMPHKYGDKIQHEHEGGVKVVVEYVDAARDQS